MIATVLYPLIWLFRQVFLLSYRVTHSFGFSLIILSFFGVALSWLLGNFFAKYVNREKEIQSILTPQIQKIKKESKSEEQHKRISALYKRYSYNPLLSLRSAIPVFIQLPFLFAAYHMIRGLSILDGHSLWIIADLASPDRLIRSINILPFIMTGINIWAAFITPDFKAKDRIQAFVIALLFLILLYSAPSALLIYWTMNNLLFLVKTWVSGISSKSKASHKVNFSFVHSDEVLSLAKLMFGFLSLFYYYQILALEKGFVFNSFLKFIPFLLASASFWVLQVIDLIRDYKNEVRQVVALVFTSFSAILFAIFGINYFVNIVPINYSVSSIVHFWAYYLSSSAIIIGMLIPNRKKEKSYVTNITGVLLIALLVLIPAIHFAKVNAEYLLGSFHIIFIISMLLLATINYFLASLSFSHKASKEVLFKSTAIFSFLIITLPLIRFFMRMTSKVDIDFWVMFALLLGMSYLVFNKNILKRVMQVLGIICIVFFITYIYSFVSGDAHRPKGKVLSEEQASIEFLEHPNIYMFCYDGMPNQRVFREQELPFDRLKSILDEYNFKLYDDAYSLGEASLRSIGKMLDMTDRAIKAPEGREIYSGNSLVNLILRNNGYSSHFLIDNSCTGYSAITYSHLYDEIFPPRTSSAAKSDYYLVLMRGILQGEMRYDTKGLIGHDDLDIQARKIDIIKEQHQRAFIVNHFHYPGHTQNSGKCLPNEKELWEGKLKISLDQMEKDFATLREYDPNAIVIAYGDHGSYLSGDCFDLSAWKKEEITTDLIWDRIGTMIAIYWPDTIKAEKYDDHIVTNQDIFPVIISYLTDDSQYLDYCPGDTFWGLATPFRTDIGFDKGKIILEK